MTKPRVYITRRVPDEGLNLLKEKCTVSMWDNDEPVPRNVLLEEVKDVQAIFCTISDEINAAVLNAAGRYIFFSPNTVYWIITMR